MEYQGHVNTCDYKIINFVSSIPIEIVKLY